MEYGLIKLGTHVFHRQGDASAEVNQGEHQASNVHITQYGAGFFGVVNRNMGALKTGRREVAFVLPASA